MIHLRTLNRDSELSSNSSPLNNLRDYVNNCSSPKDRPEAIERLANVVGIKMSLANTQPATGLQSSSNETSEPSSPPYVLLLNGYRCAGKHTIAQQLSALIPNMQIIDDLMLRLLVPEAIEPGPETQYYDLRKRVRKVILGEIKGIEDKSVTIVVTSCIDHSCPEELEEYVEVATIRQVPLIVFNISCEEREHNAHLKSAKSMKSHRSKLTSSEELQQIRPQKTLILPDRDAFLAQKVFIHHEILDTTSKSVMRVASSVYRTLKSVCALLKPAMQSSGERVLSIT